ncbi:MAG: HesA/MoeB/ThiF family protein [Maricaulaceae bacterium]
MTPDSIERYARHLVLKEIGGPGQQALLKSKVAIIGAGGLGGPAGLYLAAAGVGHITIIDDDVIEASNLQRQVQFVHTDIGMNKAVVMADTLEDLNPDVTARAKSMRLTASNAAEMIAGHDVVLDGVDNFEARYAINAACLSANIPLVSGALGRFNGQVSLFPSDGNGPCYRCLVPDIPPDAETCSAVGVIGALAGFVGSMMALETIKFITGAGTTLSGRLWLFDGLKTKTRTVKLSRDPACPECGHN